MPQRGCDYERRDSNDSSFFTTSPSDMLVSEVGSGDGFSLNYAYELAVSGMDFYAVLKYFYGDIKVAIYE